MVQEDGTVFQRHGKLFEPCFHGTPTAWFHAAQLCKMTVGNKEVALGTTPTSKRHERGRLWGTELNLQTRAKDLFQPGGRHRCDGMTPASDDLNPEIEGVVDQDAKLVRPCFMACKFVKVVNDEGGRARQGVLPLRLKAVDRGICRRDRQNMALLPTKHRLTRSVQKV